MTLTTILNFARAQAQTDSNGLTDGNGIIFGNEALQDFHRKLVNAGVDASQLQESYDTTSIDSGGRAAFLFPTNMAFLKAIEVDFTNTGNNYKTASQIDVSNLPGSPQASFSWYRSNADTRSPLFDSRGDWGEIFPAAVALVRIIYFTQPTEYTAVGDTVAYPESLDTAILGWRIAASFLYSLGDIQKGDAFNQKYEERVKQYIATLGRGTQQPTQAVPVQITGWEF